MAVSILIVDDHEVVRQGLRTILKARPEWHICGEAENGKQAIESAQQLRPDVIVLDITMPVMSGLEAAQELAKLNLDTRILIFTMHDSSNLIKAVVKAGAQGYVLKSRAAHDLIQAIEALLQGKTFLDGKSAESDSIAGKTDNRHLPFENRISISPLCAPV